MNHKFALGKSRWRQCGLSAASAVLTFLASPPFLLPFLSWICLIPWVYETLRCPNARRAAVLGLVFGSVYGLFELEWMRFAFSESWSLWGRYGIVWLLTSLIIGISYSLGSTALWLMRDQSLIPISLSVPFVIVISESVADRLLRHCGGTTLDTVQLALTQVDIPITRGLAEYGGTAGLGAFVGLVNALLLQLIVEVGTLSCVFESSYAVHTSSDFADRNRNKTAMRCSRLACVSLLCLGTWRILWSSTPLQKISAAIIPEDFSSNECGVDEWLKGARPTLVVWPESASTTTVLGEDCESLQQRAQRVGCSILVGATRIQLSPPQIYNSVILIDRWGNSRGSYDKQWLGPGEEIPMPIWKWLGLTPMQQDVPFHAGRRNRLMMVEPNFTFSVGICHDVCFPEWLIQTCHLNPDFVVLCGNETFDRSGRISKSLLALSRLRAIESRKNVLRCATGGPSGFITPDGEFTAIDERTLAIINVNSGFGPSARTTWGPWAFWLLMFGSAFIIPFSRRLSKDC